jgi:SAM-dependent methyltransferase
MDGGNGSALRDVEAFYTSNVRKLGLTAKSVGWKDEATHRLRFDKLVQGLIPDATDEPFTVNDLGSGYGAMFRYLDERYGDRLTRYHGYEISDAMIEACRAFVGADPRLEIHKTSTPERSADYSFVCGTFNLKYQATDEQWDAYVKDMILRLAQQSTRGFAFNLLSSYVDYTQDQLFHADPCRYFDFCKRNVSKCVALLHDYPLYEWTIIVQK